MKVNILTVGCRNDRYNRVIFNDSVLQQTSFGHSLSILTCLIVY